MPTATALVQLFRTARGWQTGEAAADSHRLSTLRRADPGHVPNDARLITPGSATRRAHAQPPLFPNYIHHLLAQPTGMLSSAENSSVAGADSDDDFDWEEVAVPQADQLPVVSLSADDDDVQEGPSHRPHIEITIQTEKRGKKGAKCVCRTRSFFPSDVFTASIGRTRERHSCMLSD